jgi:hypothetical protein
LISHKGIKQTSRLPLDIDRRKKGNLCDNFVFFAVKN